MEFLRKFLQKNDGTRPFCTFLNSSSFCFESSLCNENLQGDVRSLSVHDVRDDCPQYDTPDRFQQTQTSTVHVPDAPMKGEYLITQHMADVQQ